MILTDGINDYDVPILGTAYGTRSWFIFLYYYNGSLYFKRTYYKNYLKKYIMTNGVWSIKKYYKKDKVVKIPCKKEIKELLPLNVKLSKKYEK